MKLVQALQRGRKATAGLQLQPSRSSALSSRPLSTAAISSPGLPAAVARQHQQYSPRTALTYSSPSTASSKTSRRHGSSVASDEPLKKTPLYDLHMAHGAKMVPFGGFHMPVQYSSLSVSQSHHFTRSHASLFDVGHMVQHRFSGAGAAAFLERITPASLGPLPLRSSTLSTLLWPGTGGIVDDTIITKLADDAFYVVTNAACRDKDLKYLDEQKAEWKKNNGAALEHEVMDGWGLVALQGPLSEEILSSILVAPEESKLRELYFGQCRPMMVKTRNGELSQPILVSRRLRDLHPPADTVTVTESLLESAGPEKLQFAGLGARDSLRLEAGMCLYGHDLDDTTTPVEAALSWVIGKDRRDPASKNPFHGAEVILPQLTPKSKGGAGVSRRRIGLVVDGAPAREGAEIVDANGQKIGVVTSGCPSPTLGKNIAMGYIQDGSHKAGTEVEVLVRGRKRKAVVTKMPFVPSKYWKGTAPA
ncbi:glycine cleavage system t protein [Apiospora arundinis]